MTARLVALLIGGFAAVASAQDAATPDAVNQDVVLLNTASSTALAALQGVDATQADAIVALRSARGHLGSVEELRVLPGLGESTLSVLRRGTAIEVQMPARPAQRLGSVDEVLAHFDHEPTAQQVQRWASEYAKVNPELVEGWMAASRGFAALPRLWVEGRLRDGWDQGFKYYTSDGVIDTPNESVFDTLDNAGRGQDRTVLVRAVWDLDKLVMSSERIRIINESQDVVKLRDKITDEVTRLYFERRRAQVDMLLSPSADVAGQTTDYLRLMELTANLDALTGGAFSAALVRGAPAGME